MRDSIKYTIQHKSSELIVEMMEDDAMLLQLSSKEGEYDFMSWISLDKNEWDSMKSFVDEHFN